MIEYIVLMIMVIALSTPAVASGLVLVCHRADCDRKREDEMKTRHRQELGFARRKPCCRSPPLGQIDVAGVGRALGQAFLTARIAWRTAARLLR